MAHLNIYLSQERAKWLRSGLQGIAQKENRSLSYVVEEALVHFIKQQGKHVPSHSNGKITERIPLADRNRSFRPALMTAFIFCSVSVSPLHAATYLAPSDMNKIQFSDGCAEKQWTQSPDGNLELILGPRPFVPCEATLQFYFPFEARRRTAVAYELRGSKPGLSLKVGVQDPSAASTAYTAPTPVGDHWDSDGARLNHLRDHWSPRHITSLHFVVLPDPDSRWGTVTIRAIQLTHLGKPAVSALKPDTAADDVSPIAVSPASQEEPKSVPQAQTAPSTQPAAHVTAWFHTSPLFATAKILLAAGVFLFLTLPMLLKKRRRRTLSPLYEINMRTWKTHRDAHDVVAFGGFKGVTLNELRSIKQAGFNTVWFMGIWEIGPKVQDISRTYSPDFQGSPYAIYDYSLSQTLGTEQDFKELVNRAHSLRMSVLVDFVPNHMGLDSAWLNDHPDYFIHRVLDVNEAALPDDDLKQLYPGHFPYRTPFYPDGQRRVPKTLMVAYGKDPYFYPWIDTAQLDYANPNLRQKMIDVLSHWAKIVDGVRCDMAMLTVREQVKVHRHPEMSWETFNKLMPQEFWTEAIQAVKRVNPHFIFMAETYWSMEGLLQNLGFDYTYNKPLYEAVCSAMHSGHAEGLMNFLRVLGTDYLKRCVHFLENHDEERAMNSLGDQPQRAAAAILCTLPGVALFYQGQMEGKRERLPVQRVVPLHNEPVNTGLLHFYHGLLKAASLPVFQEGRMTPLYSNNSALVSYARVDNDNKVLVIVNSSSKAQKGSVFLMPGLSLDSGTPYGLNDLFYPFKKNSTGTPQPVYSYPGAKLINHGLYVELEPHDAHIFIVEPQGALQAPQKAFKAARQVIDEWPLNRVARRMLGTAFVRSSDNHLAANPAGRQQ